MTMRWGILHAGLLAALLCSPDLYAQHMGAGAGGSRAGASAHGSPSGSAPGPRLAAQPSPAYHNGAGRGWPGQTGRTGHWPSWNGTSRPTRERYSYLYPYPGYLSYGYGLPVGYDLGLDDDQNDAYGPQQQAPMQEYGPPPTPEMADNAPLTYRAPYQGEGSTRVEVHQQPATMLVFKDGRPQEKVYNYALTGSTLWVLDGDTRKEIPLATLDLPATEQANRDAGVDFALPSR